MLLELPPSNWRSRPRHSARRKRALSTVLTDSRDQKSNDQTTIIGSPINHFNVMPPAVSAIFAV